MEKVIINLKCGRVALIMTRLGMKVKGKIIISKKGSGKNE
ncbi:hypothetical protein [Bacillus phage vB_BceS-M2]|nr:hypothetical protein PBC5_092 [Bacillus phage PBC5]